jgi:diguanylate cyclase (GGDEF)-like protein
MRSVSRDYDYVGRFGGEEFLVVLRGCDKDSAVIFAERLCFCIGSKSMVLSEGTIPVTISLGVASGGGNEEHDADALVLAADKALYRAKRNGRNRVETATEELPVATP